MIRTSILSLLSLAFFAAVGSAQVAGDYETIVTQGDIADDGISVFDQFNEVELNNDSQVMVDSTLTNTPGGTTDDASIDIWTGGTSANVAREGDNVPDGSGQFADFDAELNNAGNVKLFSNIRNTGGAGNTTGVYFSSPSGIQKRVRNGDSKPGNPGVTINSILEHDFADSDEIGVLWANDNSTKSIYVTSIASSGRYVIEIDGSVSTSNGNIIDAAQLSVNSSMDSVFVGQLSGTANGTADDTAIFLHKDGTLFNVIQKGDIVDGDSLTNFLSARVSDQRLVAFQANLNNSSDTGLYVANENNVQRYIKTGMNASGGNGVYDEITFDVQTGFNQDQRIAFKSTLTGTSGGASDNEAVFRASIGGATRLAQKGESIGDLGTVTGFGDLRINNTAAVALETTGSNSAGIVVADNLDRIVAVADGQFTSGGSGTVTNIELMDLNDRGQVAYTATDQFGQRVVQVWTPDLYWRLDGSGSWEFDDRWTLAVSPDLVHDVFIQPNLDSRVEGPENDVTLKSLTVGADPDVAVIFGLADGKVTARNQMDILEGGVLAGSGEIETPLLTISGELDPEGTIELEGNLSLQPGARFIADIEAGLNDFVSVSGSTEILDAEFQLNIGAGTYLVGDVITLIDSNTSLIGQFASLNEGDLAGEFQQFNFLITYTAGDGNDVALIVAIPEPGGIFLLACVSITLAFRRKHRH